MWDMTDAPGGTPAYVQALSAAAARIRSNRRRLSLPEAARIVEGELAAHGISANPVASERFAYNVLHPFWPFLHPIRARREGWTWSWR